MKWIQLRTSIAAIAVVLAVLTLDAANSTRAGADSTAIQVRPSVPGVLRLHLRERKPAPDGKSVRVVERTADWEAAKTAVIVCDMWDDHYCKSAARRVGVMAPRMNAVLSAARDHGVMIIHAPSGTMDQYENPPYRLRMKQAPFAKPPVPIRGAWECDASREPALPVVSKC